MSIGAVKEAIEMCGKARITPFVWGFHGIGKSSTVKQLAASRGMGCIDMRCSQIEASDLRGLPDRVNGRTVFLPPADMPVGDLGPEQVLAELVQPFAELVPDGTLAARQEKLVKLVESDPELERRYYEHLKRIQPRFREGILFIDELNRAPDDVQQAAFQLVLDREVGQYVLPPGWFVVAAGNYNEGYQTSGFRDAAFLDRFCHIQFPRGETSLNDWVEYMSTLHGDTSSQIIEFATSNLEYLDGVPVGNLDFPITPSRRSWDAVARVTRYFPSHSEAAKMMVLSGLLGMEVASNYVQYSCPVKPQDLLTKGVKAVATDLGKLNRGQLTGLMWGLVVLCKPKINEDHVGNVCLDFASWMCKHQGSDRDIVVAFCGALVQTTGDAQVRARGAVISNPRLANMLGRFNKRAGGQEDFIDKLNSRPELQRLIAEVAWGGKPGEN